MKRSRAFSDRHMLRPFRSRNIPLLVPLLGCSSRTAPATQGLRRLESTEVDLASPTDSDRHRSPRVVPAVRFGSLETNKGIGKRLEPPFKPCFPSHYKIDM